jgi:hypothetical protein
MPRDKLNDTGQPRFPASSVIGTQGEWAPRGCHRLCRYTAVKQGTRANDKDWAPAADGQSGPFPCNGVPHWSRIVDGIPIGATAAWGLVRKR